MPRLLVLAVLLAAAGLLSVPASAGDKPAKRRAGTERASARGVPYAGNEDAMLWADEMAERRGLDRDWVRDNLGRAQYLPLIARLIAPPPSGQPKNWAAYRSRFIDPVRIGAGLQFWRDNQAALDRAEQDYGVPPEIIVGIVGVETIFGRQMGDFRVIDALATLAFDFPSGRKDRSAFFKEELEAWFVLCKSEGVDPLAWRGSYAGALGMAQFMPSSFNKYAVDFDGDGRVDLHASAADVIGSVANYLAEFGWKRGLPARFDVKPPTETSERAALLAPDIVPTFTAAEMVQRGAWLPEPALAADSLLALVELQNGDAAPTYVAGTTNFYALTRYNWSSYYAMAVIELGREVKEAFSRTTARNP
jgi:membrane-bound lytic murein transglycosylase B